MSKPIEIVVVGSINLDISIPVEHLPLPGETVLGGDALWSPGGKGANQAVAAARLGRRVAMVGAVGDEAAGADLVAGLARDGIDTSGVRILDGVPTGIATIGVDAGGENSIIVSPGANARLTRDRVQELMDLGHPICLAPLVMAQFETPIEALLAVAEAAPGRLILNPAPAVSSDTAGLAELLLATDVLVPNRGELATLAGTPEAQNRDELVDQARLVTGNGGGSKPGQGADVGAVVITLGGDGALVIDGSEIVSIPIVKVGVVDTTAAGDSFCGGLADALVSGATVAQAAAWATRCAAVTVTRRGAQVSLPTRAEVGAGPVSQ